MEMDLSWKRIFAPDCGTLLIIHTYETTEVEYQRLLDLLTSRYRVRYFEDDEAKDVPPYSLIVQRRSTTSIQLTVDIAGADVNCFFHSDDEINLDVLPDEIITPERAQGVFDLMKSLASTLNKKVLLTAENGSATQEWSNRFAICSVEAGTDKIIYCDV